MDAGQSDRLRANKTHPSTAGVTKYDSATDEITISLTWNAYEQHGWEQFSSTVRHELIHA
ncbi:hypothetical protein GCM10025751_47340 [Haladaptatus pallidirubidus]|uniref:SprT-like family protein n=1 Tax=Haladaptatus pallidirubidus TaxID=1008152 RepID=A0AAV3UP87_9EURY